MARKVKSWSFQPQTQNFNAINQNADELDRASQNIGSLARVAVRQGQTLADQQQQILQLRAIVTGLIDALHAKGSFEDEELESAVAQAMSEAFPPATSSGPTVTCSKCGREVAAAQTDVTETGLVCDACA
jgi:formylmethanofuran dehydrogenase subunit E